MNSCLTCGKLIMEPGVTYGYSGPVCHCLVLPQIQRPANTFGIDNAPFQQPSPPAPQSVEQKQLSVAIECLEKYRTLVIEKKNSEMPFRLGKHAEDALNLMAAIRQKTPAPQSDERRDAAAEAHVNECFPGMREEHPEEFRAAVDVHEGASFKAGWDAREFEKEALSGMIRTLDEKCLRLERELAEAKAEAEEREKAFELLDGAHDRCVIDRDELRAKLRSVEVQLASQNILETFDRISMIKTFPSAKALIESRDEWKARCEKAETDMRFRKELGGVCDDTAMDAYRELTALASKLAKCTQLALDAVEKNHAIDWGELDQALAEWVKFKEQK